MALDARLSTALNDQITTEFASAYQYLAMAAWLEEQNADRNCGW